MASLITAPKIIGIWQHFSDSFTETVEGRNAGYLKQLAGAQIIDPAFDGFTASRMRFANKNS